MKDRTLRVTTYLGKVPSAGVCSGCGRQFKAPTTTLHRASEAEANLQLQFEQHKCRSKTAKP